MVDPSGWVNHSLELGAKAIRTFSEEGAATTVAKIDWRIREELINRRADSSSPANRRLARAAVPRPLPEWPNHLTVVTPGTRSHRAERRLDHLLATARSAGIAVTPTSLNPPGEAHRLVALSNAVILYQVPKSRAVARVVALARRLGIPVFYMAVEPLLPRVVKASGGRARLPAPAAGIARDTRSALNCLKALRMADHAIGGTQELADLMGAEVPGQAFTLPYSTDESIQACSRGTERIRENASPLSQKKPVIGYESLWVGRDADLASISSELRMVLLNHPDVELHIAGECDIPERLMGLGARVHRVACSNFGERMRAMSKCTLVVSPMAPTATGLALEPLAHIHAAELGIPLLMSEVQEVEGRIDPRSLCRTPSEWQPKLQGLLDNPDLMTSLATGARARSARWGIEGSARLLTEILNEGRVAGSCA